MPDADEIKRKLSQLKERLGETEESIKRVREKISPEGKKTRKVDPKKDGA